MSFGLVSLALGNRAFRNVLEIARWLPANSPISFNSDFLVRFSADLHSVMMRSAMRQATTIQMRRRWSLRPGSRSVKRPARSVLALALSRLKPSHQTQRVPLSCYQHFHRTRRLSLPQRLAYPARRAQSLQYQGQPDHLYLRIADQDR